MKPKRDHVVSVLALIAVAAAVAPAFMGGHAKPVPKNMVEKVRADFPEFAGGAGDVVVVGPDGKGIRHNADGTTEKGTLNGEVDKKTGEVKMEDGTSFAAPTG